MRHGKRQIRGRLGCDNYVDTNSDYLPVAVAHDHGYGYLQTKDVSGAVFEGASDGVVVKSNTDRLECDRSTNDEKIGKKWKFSEYFFFSFFGNLHPLFF